MPGRLCHQRLQTRHYRTVSTILLLLSVFRSAVKDLAALWNISGRIIGRNMPIGLYWPINGAKKAFWNHLELPLHELQAPSCFSKHRPLLSCLVAATTTPLNSRGSKSRSADTMGPTLTSLVAACAMVGLAVARVFAGMQKHRPLLTERGCWLRVDVHAVCLTRQNARAVYELGCFASI